MPESPASRRTRRACSEEEVRRCWDAMTLEQRQEATRFHDPVLVERIWEASQELLKQQMVQSQVMQHLGISLPGVADGEDPFLSSELLNKAFEFSWMAQRNAQHPSIVVLDSNRPPAMALKADFISRLDFFEVLREALPDLLCPRTGRVPLSRARWKEIWAFEPSSIAQMKAQLAKLVEQALWCVPVDFPDAEQTTDGLLEITGGDVAFEPWMAQDIDLKTAEAKKKKSAKMKKKKTKTLDKVDEKSAGDRQKEDFLREVELEVAEDTWLPAGEQDDRLESIEPEDEPSCAASRKGGTPEDARSEANDFVAQLHDDSAVCEGSMEEGTSTFVPSRIHGERFILPPQTPPSSPGAGHHYHNWHPRQLVCYIWNQTSQLGASAPDEPEDTPVSRSGHQVSLGQPLSPTRPTDSSAASRGGWCRPDRSQLSTTDSSRFSSGTTPRHFKAFVKNTFIDIEDATDCPTSNTRSARSLSPSYGSSSVTPSRSSLTGGYGTPSRVLRARDVWSASDGSEEDGYRWIDGYYP